MKKVAIIGAGIVGSTAAYYLSKNPVYQVTVFDHGIGQATKAAAGIISPWFSKRRNKAWYRMARLGADFYLDLITDLQKDGFETEFYQQTGVFLLKKKRRAWRHSMTWQTNGEKSHRSLATCGYFHGRKQQSTFQILKVLTGCSMLLEEHAWKAHY